MLETNGSFDISVLPSGARGVWRIVDIKCPGSGCGDSFLIENLKFLNKYDEVKFVLSSIDDARWAKDFCIEHNISQTCAVSFTPLPNILPYDTLADWLLQNPINGVRIKLQLHKIIWGDKRGV